MYTTAASTARSLTRAVPPPCGRSGGTGINGCPRIGPKVGDSHTTPAAAANSPLKSPLSAADQITIPVLVAHGANDVRVKQAEAEQIVAALEEKGLPHEYLLFDDEGHGFAKPSSRERFYAAAERFLAEHLGGRTQEQT